MQGKMDKNYYGLENMVDGDALGRFETYFAFLVEYGSVHNITAVLERESVYARHFIDSLAGLKYVAAGNTLLDVGSGAGFPGVPLAIACPGLKLTAIDSVGKKARFLELLSGKTGVPYSVYNIRAEDLVERGFDRVTARAVAPLNSLCEYTVPFAAVGGLVFLYKNGDIEAELRDSARAIKILSGEIEGVDKYTNGGAERAIVCIRKVRETPKGYPRKMNKARTNPL